MRVLRPRISHYLDQWTRRKLPEIYMDERSSDDKPQFLSLPDDSLMVLDAAESRLRNVVAWYHDEALEMIDRMVSKKLGRTVNVRANVRSCATQTDREKNKGLYGEENTEKNKVRSDFAEDNASSDEGPVLAVEPETYIREETTTPGGSTRPDTQKDSKPPSVSQDISPFGPVLGVARTIDSTTRNIAFSATNEKTSLLKAPDWLHRKNVERLRSQPPPGSSTSVAAGPPANSRSEEGAGDKSTTTPTRSTCTEMGFDSGRLPIGDFTFKL